MKTKESKPNILFLCTGNSCRSQMAEGWAKALKSDKYNFFSAGIETHGMNQNAIKVMKEAGIDINDQYSKIVDEIMHIGFDVVITVCGHADETCPNFPGKTKVIHVGFDDPPKLAKEAKTVEQALIHYRRVRDEIKEFVLNIEETIQPLLQN